MQRAMDEEKPQKTGGNPMDIESDPIIVMIRTELNEMYRDIMGTEQFFSSLLTIHKLVMNIASNPDEEKFRKLNLSNNTIATLFGKSPAIARVFQTLGFKQSQDGQTFVLGEPGQPLSNACLFKRAVTEIQEFGDKISTLPADPRQTKSQPWSGQFFSI